VNPEIVLERIAQWGVENLRMLRARCGVAASSLGAVSLQIRHSSVQLPLILWFVIPCESRFDHRPFADADVRVFRMIRFDDQSPLKNPVRARLPPAV
jgi:hypothetical protein